jgi:5-methylcytosine-specific restriction endonuclease McrA
MPNPYRPRPHPEGWKKIRERILERDGHRCTVVRSDGTRCTAPAYAVDHLINVRAGGTEDDSNLASMCRWHHDRKTSAEGNRARKRVRQAREPEPHPGIIR